jgi:hypothetical protein
MGASGSVKVGDAELGGFKNNVDPIFCIFFQEREKTSGEYEEQDGDDSYTVSFVHYKTTVETAAARLSLMGFSPTRCEARFSKERDARIAELDSELASEPDCYESPRRQGQLEAEKELLELYRALTFPKWKECLRWLADNHKLEFPDGLRQYLDELELDEDDETIDKFALLFDSDDEDYFPLNLDLRVIWASVLSTFDPAESVVMDISYMVESRYLAEDSKVINDGWSSLRHGIAENEPILVLTEGSSDATILKLSLSALYPELEERFQFLDFDASKYGGGAPSLVAQVKGFAAAGVRNKILGILDNDAAAREALRPLEKITLPSNIGVMRLPELALASHYPTIGPLGKLNGNVNGLAVSIEFFAGERLLSEVGGGELDAVVWGSYYPKMETYQGELKHKEAAAKALRESLSEEKDSSSHRAAHPELCELWEQIFRHAEALM